MGTNFYTLKGRHIGKRSAAGWYCWDCGITLCQKGDNYVHHGDYRKGSDPLAGWWKACPKCGKEIPHEGISDGAMGRELGFNDGPKIPKRGVASCASFTWATDPYHGVKNIKYVKDEYGRVFTFKEFEDMLRNECPIWFYSIGTEFC